MQKKDIESLLIEKPGYLKKSPKEVAKCIWKSLPKEKLPRTHEQLDKELKLIGDVQKAFRIAKSTIQEHNLLPLVEKILQEKERPKKKLFFDIEVSPNLVFSWRVGNKINLPYDSIIEERKVICISYKWAHEDKVKSLRWNWQDDRKMLEDFSKIIESADEVVTQNGDAFDIKWLRTRCLVHGIKFPVKLNSIDTLKMARNSFNFNSNKLDYMGNFLGQGEKIKTDFSLWTRIILHGNEKALDEMVKYCNQDVILLEKVYDQLKDFCPQKKFRYKI